MKQSQYSVTFVTGKKEIVWAVCQEEAEILAQATQIRRGDDHTVSDTIKLR